MTAEIEMPQLSLRCHSSSTLLVRWALEVRACLETIELKVGGKSSHCEEALIAVGIRRSRLIKGEAHRRIGCAQERSANSLGA
jgi:hypothetical protein